MAERIFEKMTTKKLNALLATANEEDKAAILDVLESRGQAPAEEKHDQNVQEYHAEEPLTEEEQKMLDAAEANGGINPMYNGAGGEKKQKMTDEERHTLAESLKENIYRRCQAVPFNTANHSIQQFLDFLDQRALLTGTNLLVNNLTSLDEDDGRDVTHTVFHRDFVVLLDIALADNNLALILGSQLLHNGSNHAAGTAPLSPEVNYHRKLTGQQFVEVVLVNFHCHSCKVLDVYDIVYL